MIQRENKFSKRFLDIEKVIILLVKEWKQVSEENTILKEERNNLITKIIEKDSIIEEYKKIDNLKSILGSSHMSEVEKRELKKFVEELIRQIDQGITFLKK
ncbi:MAG: hypothetical protein QM536_01240 [Chitinophagaceae bacterium]|nr:hypothetical protein [Chitinophagaceae bacterium]